MADRILRWLVYTFLFALLPILIDLLFTALFNLANKNHVSELLFFTIMLCATSLNDIHEAQNNIENDILFKFFFSVCILILITVSAVYGGLFFFNMSNSNSINQFAIVLCFISGILGFVIQILLQKAEVSNE